MGTYYLDASAVAKRYLPEPGSRWIEALMQRTDELRFVSVELVALEVVCAITRAFRERRISSTRRDQAIARLALDAQTAWSLWAVTDLLLRRASRLAIRHPLRAYDAIHLASALAWADDLREADLPAPCFVSADTTLLAVARAEGLTIENPNEHP